MGQVRYTPKEIAEMVGVCRRTVYRHIIRGNLETFYIGKVERMPQRQGYYRAATGEAVRRWVAEFAPTTVVRRSDRFWPPNLQPRPNPKLELDRECSSDVSRATFHDDD